jgi:hypothetical protein
MARNGRFPGRNDITKAVPLKHTSDKKQKKVKVSPFSKNTFPVTAKTRFLFLATDSAH